jgi:hypothetical protein
MHFWGLLETLSFGENKLYECKVSWNRIVKGIESLIFKDFCIIYEPEIHGRKMMWHNSYI